MSKKIKYLKVDDPKTTWEDCAMGFLCPNCNASMVLDTQSGRVECSCGRVYLLSTTVFEVVGK